MDPFKILGVDQTASKEEIQRAYRRQAQKHHPELGGDNWAFQQVQEAYDAITNQPATTPPSAHSGQPKPPPATTTQQDSPQAKSKTAQSERHWWQLFVGHLPLEKETMLFIVVNCLDIFLTHKLINAGAVEANPIAKWVLDLWNFNGMIAFKLSIVASVCVIAQVIALKRIRTARALLIAGIVLVGMVVFYSMWLYVKHF